MNSYVCSSCRRPIGRMLDEKGEQELFKCPNNGMEIAIAIPLAEAVLQ